MGEKRWTVSHQAHLKAIKASKAMAFSSIINISMQCLMTICYVIRLSRWVIESKATIGLLHGLYNGLHLLPMLVERRNWRTNLGFRSSWGWCMLSKEEERADRPLSRARRSSWKGLILLCFGEEKKQGGTFAQPSLLSGCRAQALQKFHVKGYQFKRGLRNQCIGTEGIKFS